MLETLLGQAYAVASMTFVTSEAALSAGDTLAAELHEQAVAAWGKKRRGIWGTMRGLREAVDAGDRAGARPV
ncbi:multidrug DMT transporter, partial [Escherichia coli]